VVLTSTNGASWAVQDSGQTNDLFGLAYGAAQLVAVTRNGNVLSSSDAVHWTSRNAGTTANLFGVAYGNGLFAAVGSDGAVYTSPDATGWARSFQTAFLYEGIVFANGLFLPFGNSATLLTSPDGTNWSAHSTSAQGPTYAYTAAYGNGTFVAAGVPGTYIRTSPDGTNWSLAPSGFGSSISGITFANGRFVAAADSGTILTSTNGTAWTVRASGASRNLWSVAYGDGTHVIVGENGVILQSDSTIPPVLAGAYNSPQDQFTVSLTGELGRSYRIQAAPDLSGPWQDLVLFTNTSPTMQFVDPDGVAATSRRYYRGVTP
jgi:hypothetical protein